MEQEEGTGRLRFKVQGWAPFYCSGERATVKGEDKETWEEVWVVMMFIIQGNGSIAKLTWWRWCGWGSDGWVQRWLDLKVLDEVAFQSSQNTFTFHHFYSLRSLGVNRQRDSVIVPFLLFPFFPFFLFLLFFSFFSFFFSLSLSCPPSSSLFFSYPSLSSHFTFLIVPSSLLFMFPAYDPLSALLSDTTLDF